MPVRGFALVLVLWIMSILMIMASSFALTMRRESVVVAAIKNNAEASAVAESGLVLAQLMLLHPEPVLRWRANGSIYQITDTALLGTDNAELRVRLLSEAGKIDINKADAKLLAELLAHAPILDDKQREQLVGAWLDWRDADDLLNLNGAEKKEYLAAGLRYQPRNKPFQTVDELQLLLGMNETLYEWLVPLVTVYSGGATVDKNVASREVLQILPDAELELIDAYMIERLQSTQQGLPEPIPPSASLTAGSLPASQPGAQAGQTQGTAITVVAEAMLEDGASAALTAVIRRGGDAKGQPFQVLEWQRNMPGTESLFADRIGASPLTELLVKHYAESK